ncbi:MAG TPA: hypothetical protein DHN33_12055 [Eubacteriaceae bacterium]|nr:hypothetical protein [Eubacteriaceae bacterium]
MSDREKHKKHRIFRRLSRSIEAVGDSVTRRLRLSIRTRISFNYIALYTFVAGVTLLVFVCGYLVMVENQVMQSNQGVLEGIPQNVQSLTEEEATEYLSRLKEDNRFSIAAYTSENTVFYPEESPIIWYQNRKNANIVFENLPFLSMYRYQLLPKEIYTTIADGQQMLVVLFFDVSTYWHALKFFVFLLAIAYLFGLFILWTLGSFKLKRVFQPIRDITQIARETNVQNLDRRIDVSTAKYELKDLAITINEMIDRIQEGYKRQQRFVSDVSHELRTPISVIQGYANMLDRWGKKDPEVLQESIDALTNEAQNMQNLVEGLLFLARHDKETLQLDKRRFDLSEIVESIIKDCEVIDKNHVYKYAFESNSCIHADLNQIKQCLRIFLDNAKKYTPDGKNIFVRVGKEGRYAFVDVQDEGVGIAKEDLHSIFERFYRADESRTKTTGGYGLGLSIAKAIVLEHKGKIQVRTKLNEGSSFRIYLPIEKE